MRCFFFNLLLRLDIGLSIVQAYTDYILYIHTHTPRLDEIYVQVHDINYNTIYIGARKINSELMSYIIILISMCIAVRTYICPIIKYYLCIIYIIQARMPVYPYLYKPAGLMGGSIILQHRTIFVPTYIIKYGFYLVE